jgi:Zn-dependent peptidase ImmA (M78 family)
MKGKRLSKKKWKKIEKEIQNPDRNISKIAKKFKISRHALYTHSYTRGLLNKQEKKSFWQKIKKWVRFIIISPQVALSERLNQKYQGD